MAGRAQPDWDFSKFFLVKDSLAAMLESASLLEDALREYTEMEALFLTTTAKLQPGNPEASGFGKLIYVEELYTSTLSRQEVGQPVAEQGLLAFSLAVRLRFSTRDMRYAGSGMELLNISMEVNCCRRKLSR